MNAKAFFAAVQEHPDLAWIGVNANPPEVFIRQNSTDGPLDRAVTIPSLLTAKWADLEAVLTGKKEGRVMLHMTRIVGYYSYTQGWNKSKLAELRDRHKGDYLVPVPEAVAHV
ncbi:hypothetical protein LCGC14_3163450 [marine sediment metagenome]|uniref:Uncharacterized protein n=1 Tax=marine sediment metagenome TaxID=412755 RepID=A0A0F8VQP6_9ZZZZ